MKNQTQKSAILSENHPPAFAVEFITDKKQLCEQASMKVKHSLPFPFLVLINKVKKDGGYNSCYFLSLAGRMLTTGWHQKRLFGHECFWPTASWLFEQDMQWSQIGPDHQAAVATITPVSWMLYLVSWSDL